MLDPAGEQGAEFYFSAWTLAEGRELYRTDGTAVGTTLVTDASPGWVGSNPVVLGRVGGSLLLSADVQGPSGGVGQELYRLDASGLVLVQDLLPGPAVGMPHSSSPRAPVQIGSDLLFVTSNDHDAETLWRTDGTASGTTELLVNEGKGASWEVYPAPTPTNWGGVFFVADAESTGQELYVSDGTVHGTGLAIDLNPATEGVSSSPVLLGVLDGDDLIVATTKGPERIVRWSEGEGLEVCQALVPTRLAGIHRDRERHPELVEEGRQARGPHGLVVLEHAVQTDDRDVRGIEGGVDARGLGDSVHDTTRAQHLEGVQHDDASPQGLERGGRTEPAVDGPGWRALGSSFENEREGHGRLHESLDSKQT